jgi:hypothetical protein
MQKYWKIQGWDSTEKLFEFKVKLGQITENGMFALLRALTAKYALTDSEIISSYAKKKTKISASYLEVQRLSGKKYTLSCGTNPYVMAVVEDE